jgi:hypothetical protein
MASNFFVFYSVRKTAENSAFLWQHIFKLCQWKLEKFLDQLSLYSPVHKRRLKVLQNIVYKWLRNILYAYTHEKPFHFLKKNIIIVAH